MVPFYHTNARVQASPEIGSSGPITATPRIPKEIRLEVPFARTGLRSEPGLHVLPEHYSSRIRQFPLTGFEYLNLENWILNNLQTWLFKNPLDLWSSLEPALRGEDWRTWSVIPIEATWKSSSILTNAKWSSKGGTVCLVDLQEQQLQDGLQYVEKLRAETNDAKEWGKIEISHPSSLDTLLRNAWLVVEVC